ncbi:glycosyltransferase family 2 protein [Enterobacteriaceae bacterium C34A]
MSLPVKIGLAIVTYNGGKIWEQAALAIHQNCNPDIDVIVIDSQSKDNTQLIAKKYNYIVHEISSADFNHGGTRNLAMNLFSDKDYVIFLTQDAILANKSSVINLINYMSTNDLSAAYGKQLPHDDANAIAEHARYFNYGNESFINTQNNIAQRGIKTVFMSNSFSAYRVNDFHKIGGFPTNTILCEDMFFAAKAIVKGFRTGYCAEAVAHHSHNYTTLEEFKRYFDIGVFHHDEPWIKESFSGVSSEGTKFIKSEINFLTKKNFWMLFKAFTNNAGKIIGYKIGLNYKKLPKSVIKKISMHKRYWDKQGTNRMNYND